MKTLLKMKLQRKILVEQQRAQKGKIELQASQTSDAHAVTQQRRGMYARSRIS